MSEILQPVIFFGIFFLVGGLALYWVFFRMDNPSEADPVPNEPVPSMSDDDIRHIESALEVSLPETFSSFLKSDRDEKVIDNTTVFDDPDSIISATRDYRSGFEGLSPWPSNYVYVGDEADACPYFLDCATGKLFRSDKGNIQRKPLDEYLSFDAFFKKRQREAAEEPETENEPETWKDRFVMIRELGVVS